MLIFSSTPPVSMSPTPQQMADLRLAASQMTGATRRAFQAEMTLKYGDGNARRAEDIFSLHAAFSGRQRWEDHYPEAAEALVALAFAHSQQDPTFRTPVSYTRLTAKTALEGLRQKGVEAAILPAPSTMAVILNRLGFRLRNVVKSKPLKKVPQTDAIFANVKKKTGKPSETAR